MKKVRLLILAGFVSAIVCSRAATLAENFSADPLQNGWQVFGDTNLFQWDSTNQNLRVTWDSSQPDSYFYKPLGAILAIDDNFTVEFDLQLSDASAVGYFELAAGLFNFTEATNSTFSRPDGDTPDLFEFDYYPGGPQSDGPSIDATLSDMTVSATNDADFSFSYDDSLSLNNGVMYHILLKHLAGATNIIGEILAGGQVYTSLTNVYAGPITDFRLDTISVSSYSDANDPYGPNSLLAHGTVGNIVVTFPPPPVQNLTVALSNGVPLIQFGNRTNWLYTLQRMADFQTWSDVSSPTPGNGTNLFLQDTNPMADKAFYRIRANRP